MSQKKKKLSDRIVAKLWGKKKKTVIADDNKVKVIEGDFNPLPRQDYLGEELPIELGNPNEALNQIMKDPITMSSIEDPDSDLMIQFEKETGKHAVWGGRKTKQFLNWKMKIEVI